MNGNAIGNKTSHPDKPFALFFDLFFRTTLIDKFSDLKNLNISKETKIYGHSWKQRAKISITAKFEEEIS